MKYGKTSDRHIIDADSGSTLEVETNYKDGKTFFPVRRRFEIRHACKKTDLQTLASIAQALLSDDSKLDTSLRLEKGKKNDKYHIVECYTQLVY